MKIRIPIMVQDTLVTHRLGLPAAEGFDAEALQFFDGPATQRVRMVISDAVPLRYAPPVPPKVCGHFYDERGNDVYEQMRKVFRAGDSPAVDAFLHSDTFLLASTFSAVLRTLELFENKHIMGRPLHWQFGDAPLMVYPRYSAGKNAMYVRDHKALYFYYDQPPGTKGETIYFALSRDVVAHETGHAIIDGIEPSLFEATGPHPRAIHEGLADIISVLLAFKSHALSKYVLDHKLGSILEATAFSNIADEIGPLLLNRPEPLRALINDLRLVLQRSDTASSQDPYKISLVVSGMLYALLQRHHELCKTTWAADEKFCHRPDPIFSASGEALRECARYLRSIAFRALDYLPPGEVTLADYGRAMLAVSQLTYPADTFYRNWVIEELDRRAVIVDRRELELDTPHQLPGKPFADLRDGRISPEEFVESNRTWFGLQSSSPYVVRPILSVKPTSGSGQRIAKQGIVKVLWEEKEFNPRDPRLKPERWVQAGTTAVFDWQHGEPLVRLSSARPVPPLYLNKDRYDLAIAARQRRQQDIDAYVLYLLNNRYPARQIVRDQPTIQNVNVSSQ